MAEDDRPLFHFEDYTPGFETTGGHYHVREEEIVEFGERFDPQPFHTDPKAAATSHFGGLVAPGCLTFAIRSALVNQLEMRPALIAGLGVGELELPAPVRPGDDLTLRMRVVSRRASKTRPDRGVVCLEYAVLNQRGEETLTMGAKMLVRRRDADATSTD